MPKENNIRVAVIGCGERMRVIMRNLFQVCGNSVKVGTMYDPEQSQCKRAASEWKDQHPLMCTSYTEALQGENISWVLVFSPNAYHKEHILASFDAGKHIFTEKPLAVSIQDCREIYNASLKSNSVFMTGFVLRYSPLYVKAKEILDSGKLGKILSINADENIPPDHGGYIAANWRRNSEIAGPHILEKCCHDLDLINWFTSSLPSKIAAFGSLDFFKAENEYYNEKYGATVFSSWEDPFRTHSPFLSDKSIKDTQVAVIKYRNGVKVQFQATMSNAIPERRMYIACTDGTMILDLYTGSLRWRSIGEKEEHRIQFTVDGHGGGDRIIAEELYDSMLHGTKPKSSGDEGLNSALTALAIDQAMNEERVIDMESIWKELNR